MKTIKEIERLLGREMRGGEIHIYDLFNDDPDYQLYMDTKGRLAAGRVDSNPIFVSGTVPSEIKIDS